MSEGSRIKPPERNRIRAMTVQSTKSSLDPKGKLATSSTNSSAHLVLGTQQVPDATISVTEFNLAVLSPEPR